MAFELQHLPADVFGLSDWARAALADRPQPAAFPGMIVPREPDEMPVPNPPLPDEDRSALAATLERNLSAYEPHVAVIDSVRSLAQRGASFVIAGQQPGLFGGPTYNAYKAVHVIRLARELSARWNRPVVPAFWNHGDDHDVAEVHHVWVRNQNLDLRKIGLAGMSSGRTPVSRIRFDEERHRLSAARELLRENLWNGENTAEAVELCVPRAGESFSTAFTRILLSLFGHHGLVVIEPDWIREPLSRALARVVATDAAEHLREGAARLSTTGFETTIDPSTAALLFRLVDDKRRALRLSKNEFRYDEEAGSRTGTELAAEIIQDPEEWSPGALLRPLIQDLCLPVAAYVGGWGEFAYHTQLVGLRQAAGVPHTPFVPRLSCTLIDDQEARSLTTLDRSLGEVLAARGKLGEGVSPEAGTQAPVVAKLQEVADRTANELLELRAELAELDRGLAQQLKKNADQVRQLVDRLAGKAERVQANAAGRGRRHFRRLNSGLFPRGQPQERGRALVEFLARFGTSWLDQLVEEIDPLPTEHLAVSLS